jgi:NADH-quinone oxidoreductase subunit G
VVLASLLEALGDEAKGSDLASVWAELAETVPALGGISYANVPKTGLLIDGSAWNGLDFPEGEALHFNPATTEASA